MFSLYSEAPYKIFLQNKEIILLIISKYCFNCKEEKHATKKYIGLYRCVFTTCVLNK